MSNNRLYYAVESVGLAKNGTNTFTGIRGLQSISTNLKFNLEQFFEIGQVNIYANLENLPDTEVTLEKLLDGYAPIYMQATNGASSPTLSGRSNVRTILGLSVFTDTQDCASGTPIAQATLSGMFVSSVAYNIQVGGAATEQVGLVGNNQTWTNTFTAPTFAGSDTPLAGTASGMVNRRQDIIQGSAATLWPQDIPGISASGTNDLAVNGFYNAKIQSVKTSVNLGRQQMLELGTRGPYFRYVQFPVEVKTDIEVLSQSGNSVQAVETSSSNLSSRAIRLVMREGLRVDLGNQNLLQSVTTNGGNAQQNGQNVSETYSYLTYSVFTVTHPQDPSGL